MTLRIPSGDTNQGVSFNSLPGLPIGNFAVWRSRNGAAAVQMTTPTISEDGSLPGQYHLTLDEDMTIGAGNATEHLLYTIRHSDAPSLNREFEAELFVPPPIRKGQAFANFTFVLIGSSDHATPIAGRTVTAQRSIDGASFDDCANAVSEIGNGAYAIDLASTDLDGNVVALKFAASGADTRIITIIPAAA